MAKDPVCGMDVSEAQSLKLTKDGQTHYFCSENCLKKFARQNKISDREVATCLVQPKVKWYKNKTTIVASVLSALCILSYIVPILEPFRKSLLMYFERIWWAILLGFILGGIIDHFIPREYISYFLAKPKRSTIFYSVILGFFMSACSHGILALSIELHKKGASNPAVVAFLLASPWANFTLTIMLIGFFGAKALFIIISALIIAIITGFIFQFLESKDLIEKNKNIREIEEGFSVFKDLKARFSSYKLTSIGIRQDIKGVFSGSISLANMVLWWILIGMGLASLSAAYIPQNIFQNYMGPNALGLTITLVVATILEVCSEGTAPLAFEIYRQTRALGNAFVFLMAGVVTDYTEIGLLWHNVGRRVAIWLPVVTVPQVVAMGILANTIF
ncbi:MAG: permease [Candidatus Omnitrophota bacterium]|nr:MAG: permease [Candidatus Omnitrophota bacterium]